MPENLPGRKAIDLVIGTTGRTSHVRINGQECFDVTGVDIHMDMADMTTVTIRHVAITGERLVLRGVMLVTYEGPEDKDNG